MTFPDLPRAYVLRVVVSLLTASIAALAVMVFHDPYHAFFTQVLNKAPPFSDALGTVLIVLASFLIQFLLSLIYFHDASLGVVKKCVQEAKNEIHKLQPDCARALVRVKP